MEKLIFPTGASIIALFSPFMTHNPPPPPPPPLAPVEKKSYATREKKVYFTRVIVAFALIEHQILYSQNKFFLLAGYIVDFIVFIFILLPVRGNKIHFMTL